MSPQGSQGGGCRLGQGFWAGLGQVQRPFVQVQRSLQLHGGCMGRVHEGVDAPWWDSPQPRYKK